VFDAMPSCEPAILAGRRWHDVATERCGGRAGIYGGEWNGPVFVLTHEPPSDPPDPGIRFVSGTVEDAVAAARDAAGGGRVGIFGAGVARQLLAGGLLDEIVVHIVPVLLGAGVRLYGDDGAPTVTLKRIGATLSPQLTDLRFRIAR
jgi:dihydrofolate reductase